MTIEAMHMFILYGRRFSKTLLGNQRRISSYTHWQERPTLPPLNEEYVPLFLGAERYID